jgi:hypothetical protein
MTAVEEFAMGDPAKDYCVHCARPDGSMQSFEEKLASLTGFIVRTQGFAPAAAAVAAKVMMKPLPAWSDRAEWLAED